MTKLTRIAPLTAILLAGLGLPAEGRVISYAPVTARTAIPAVQSRLDRRHLLVERAGATQGPWMGPICLACVSTSRLVVYDALGIDEPSDVSPAGQGSRVTFAAALEVGGVVRLLVASDARLKGESDANEMRLLYSPDTGTTWRPVPLPSGLRAEGVAGPFQKDVGGWVARERGASVRLGVEQSPFILVLNTDGGALALVAVDSEGGARVLATMTSRSATPLAGEDYDWKRFYVVADSIQPGSGGSGSGDLGKPGLFLVDLTGSVSLVLGLGSTSSSSSLYAWMAADGPTYVQFDGSGELPAPFGAPHVVGVVRDGSFSELATADEKTESLLFAIPSAYWKGAWILKRDAGPTVLLSHSPAQGLVTRWSDVTRPEVEALHAGISGSRLLVQVHRPRQTPERRFLDPAIAMWEFGQPAPARYDELFLNEQSTKGFVHLDVDAVSTGRSFLFDSGEPELRFIPAGPSGGGGGADVVQEWGVVKASLYQRLVIPAAARAAGVGGSTWRTDLVLRNPDDAPLPVTVRLLANPYTADVSAETSLVLAPGEIRLVADALLSLFDLERGSGALLLVPEGGRSVEATSRTYSVGDRGTFGMGVGAVDLYAGSSPNFPVTFAAALLGPGFRTNLVATDASGRGSLLSLSLAPASPDVPPVTFSLEAPVGKQRQLNGLAEAAGVPAGSRGSLSVAPETGEVIAGLTAIDNATNDPTWFGPDLPATVTRTIPALVHADGKNGAVFRSDLYLFNPTDEMRSVSLGARDWQSPQTTKWLYLTLLPGESKVIRDALQAAFGLTGVAQVSFASGASFTTAEGIRATSRTYTTAPGGGTYGHPVPPLNAFQSVTSGETLQILGPVQAPGFRTNLAIVDLLPPGNLGATLAIRVEIVDSQGRVADSFTTPLAPGAGVQLSDLFNARGLRSDLGPVLIRVSPSGGSVAAYATTIDDGTNDPTYFQAVLSANPD